MYHSLFSLAPFSASHLGKRASSSAKSAAPEVHGDARVEGDLHGVRLVLAVLGDVAGANELRHLLDVGEVAAAVDRADAARDGAVLGEREREVVADHREVAAAVGGRGRREELAEPGERVATVEVVGVDRGERGVDDVARGADRVRGAPRLRAPGRDGVRRGEVVQVLERVRDLHDVLVLRADLLAEHVLEVLADDEHDLAEPGALRVEHGIVEYGLAGRAHRVHLLQPAVPGSHSRGQHDQRRLHFAHLSLLLSFLVLLLTCAK